jgi:hypothetical protein
MTETRTRVPLTYVGWWNRRDAFERVNQTGRVNAHEVEGHAPHTLGLSGVTMERIDCDVVRAVVRWTPVGGFDYFDLEGGVTGHVSAEVLHGGTVDTSGWGLSPMYERKNPGTVAPGRVGHSERPDEAGRV